MKESLLMGIAMGGLVNALYGAPVALPYILVRGKMAFLWAIFFLLGNACAYFALILLTLYLPSFVSLLFSPLARLIVALLILAFVFFISLTVWGTLSRSRFFVHLREHCVDSPATVFFLGALVGLYVGRNMEGVGLYFRDMAGGQYLPALLSVIFSLGVMVSPLPFLGISLVAMNLAVKTRGERATLDALGALALLFGALLTLHLGRSLP